MINNTLSTIKSYKTLPDDSASLTTCANVRYMNVLPDLIIRYIASKLALPDLLSFKQTCHQVNSCIGKRIISEAKNKSYYKFELLIQAKKKHKTSCVKNRQFFLMDGKSRTPIIFSTRKQGCP